VHSVTVAARCGDVNCDSDGKTQPPVLDNCAVSPAPSTARTGSQRGGS
jgi:hypothetical protein